MEEWMGEGGGFIVVVAVWYWRVSSIHTMDLIKTVSPVWTEINSSGSGMSHRADHGFQTHAGVSDVCRSKLAD